VGVVAKYYDVCVCVFLSVHKDISGTTYAVFTKCLCMLLIVVAQFSYGSVMKSHGEGAFFRVFFLNNNALYSIAFCTHTQTTESIKMPCGMMSGLGLRKCVTWG